MVNNQGSIDISTVIISLSTESLLTTLLLQLCTIMLCTTKAKKRAGGRMGSTVQVRKKGIIN